MSELGWEWIAGLIVIGIVAFVVRRATDAGEDRADLSGLPPSMTHKVPAPGSSTNLSGAAQGVPAAEGIATSAVGKGVSLALSLLPEPDRAAIVIALGSGNKIEAIKKLREATGMGLAEAKDAVEAIQRAGPR